MLIPRRYGGAGLDALAFAICVEELAQACASTAVIVDVHTSVGTEPILLFGDEEQKRRWLPRLASGELLGAFALTEPASGSDAAALQTTARRDGDSYVLRGTKIFITNIGHAGLYVVFARTGPDEKAAGVTAFLVPADAPGLRPRLADRRAHPRGRERAGGQPSWRRGAGLYGRHAGPGLGANRHLRAGAGHRPGGGRRNARVHA
ncbi:MAG: hypothetical protein E6H95_12340 [Chloroflexi bacterium]|nr:MAG: hypothetical protein E6H95_12340 [Chloroflexota bacterium]